VMRRKGWRKRRRRVWEGRLSHFRLGLYFY
jgi:hypothetical protein